MTRDENAMRVKALCREDLEMEALLAFDLLNIPEINDFLLGVQTEAAHQRQRWGAPHDREKSPEHWFWLIGYLAGKALRSALSGDLNKAKHHCISTAAALFHWHTAVNSALERDADLARLDQPPLPQKVTSHG